MDDMVVGHVGRFDLDPGVLHIAMVLQASGDLGTGPVDHAVTRRDAAIPRSSTSLATRRGVGPGAGRTCA